MVGTTRLHRFPQDFCVNLVYSRGFNADIRTILSKYDFLAEAGYTVEDEVLETEKTIVGFEELSIPVGAL